MGWYDALKDAAAVADRLRDAELKQKLATALMECAALAEENARLREERNELQAKLQAKATMVHRSNV